LPTCIYCTRPTTAEEPAAHIFPESLVTNDVLLPAGAECAECNQYLGYEVDAALLHFPWIGFCIQFLALPGKRGKPARESGASSATTTAA